MKKYFLIAVVAIVSTSAMAQNKKSIKIIHADFTDINQQEIPGAILFTGNVQVSHDGIIISCNKAYHFQGANYVKAFGNVQLNQGDTIKLNSQYAEYNGNQKFAFATGNVRLQSPESSLTTDTINFDRTIQQAFYKSNGTIVSKDNLLKSKTGRYFAKEKKYQFQDGVVVNNPQCTIKSNHLDFYDQTGKAFVFGPSTISSKNNTIYTENGVYDTKRHEAELIKNSEITYNNRKIRANHIFYDRKKDFSSATRNVKITDDANKMVARGHYAELYKAKDSLFLKENAIVATLVEKDSAYFHAQKIVVTGKPNERIIRGYQKARFFKPDLSGKCDSLHYTQKNGLTKLIGKPIMWSQNNQLTGEEIHLINNLKSQQLDSLKVIKNAFMIQQDSLGKGFNQIKGVYINGKFNKNELETLAIQKNAEIIYFMYSDKNEFIGINKGICSNIEVALDKNKIQTATLFVNPESHIYPENELPENVRKLRGFEWRGDERIKTVSDLFSEEEKQLALNYASQGKKQQQIQNTPLQPLPSKKIKNSSKKTLLKR